MSRKYVVIVATIALFTVAACQQTIPKEALQFTPETLEDRQMQTRRFDTDKEREVISASAALLQDLGFNLDESESKLGVVVASKERDAVESGQVAGAIVVAILFGAYIPTDKIQKIKASVVSRPIGEESKNMAVRVTFQRTVWNEQGQISKQERLNDPKMYQEFFSKLSKALFLEAHQI